MVEKGDVTWRSPLKNAGGTGVEVMRHDHRRNFAITDKLTKKNRAKIILIFFGSVFVKTTKKNGKKNEKLIVFGSVFATPPKTNQKKTNKKTNKELIFFGPVFVTLPKTNQKNEPKKKK